MEKQDSNFTNRMICLEQELTPEEPKFHNLPILKLKISILCLSTFYFGYSLASLSTISTNSMIQEFGQITQNSTVSGFLIGVLTLGAAFGAFSSPFLMKCFTRRNFIILFSIGALVIEGLIQYPKIYCLFICRASQGFIIGNFMALVPVYVKQLAPKQVLETFGVFAQLFVVFGVVFAYLLGIILQKSGVAGQIMWRIMFGFDIVTITTVLLNCLLGVIPQSPNSLIMKENNQEAKRVINLFTKKQYIQEVFKQKLMEVQYELNKSQNQEDQKALKYSTKAYFIGFLLPFMQQCTGVNALVTQIGDIVSKHNPQFGYYTPLIINFVQLGGTIGAIYALNSFGRKTILLTGNLGLGICDLLIGVLFVFIEKSDGIFWMIFSLLIIYMLIYGLTIGPVVWMYVPQIIPAKVVPFATTLNWLACSFCLIISPIINEHLGPYVIFFIFGAITMLIGIINIFGIVEIKGLNVKQVCEAYNR